MNERKLSTHEMEADQVTDQARRLRVKLEEMKAATRSLKWTGRGVTALVAVVSVVGVVVLVRPLVSAYNSPQPYKKAFNAELEREVVPALQAESQALFKAVGPDILLAIRQNTTRRFPEITARLEHEGQALVEELSAEAKGRVSSRSGAILHHLDEKLAGHLPSAGDPKAAETALANAHTASQGALNRFLDTYLKEHIADSASLQARVEQFPIPEYIRKMTDDQLRDHLTETLGVLAMNRLQSARSPQMREFILTLEKPATTERKTP